jgi:ketosteroid isomerase-like protein
MSEENLELVRRASELWSEGDLDAWAELHDPNVEVTPPAGWPEGEDPQGIEAWRRQADRLREPWEHVRIEIDELRPAEGNRVVSRFRYVTQGRDGMSFDTPMAAVFVLADGKVVRNDYFWDFADALEAAGLSE